MTKLGNASLIWRLRREGIGVGLVAALAFVGVALADAPAGPPDNPAVAGRSGSTIAPAAISPAAARVEPVLADDPKPAPSVPSREQQRRVLMLLLMNSAGPLGPYGGLGR
jgi:hypothetical protein